MTTRQLVDELISAWRANDPHRAAAFFAPDGRYHETGHAPVSGRERIAEHFTRFFRDGPLWRFEVDDVVVEGERAAVAFRFAVKGDDQPWRERAGCAWVRLEGGLIDEWREYHG
ncbi:MAG: nuclear transport factor 2 family protein [Candidatus Tumulicola sp.]